MKNLSTTWKRKLKMPLISPNSNTKAQNSTTFNSQQNLEEVNYLSKSLINLKKSCRKKSKGWMIRSTKWLRRIKNWWWNRKTFSSFKKKKKSSSLRFKQLWTNMNESMLRNRQKLKKPLQNWCNCKNRLIKLKLNSKS